MTAYYIINWLDIWGENPPVFTTEEDAKEYCNGKIGLSIDRVDNIPLIDWLKMGLPSPIVDKVNVPIASVMYQSSEA